MAGRAGGQIFRDVLRRKMNAKYDNPNYDDQGQEMETYDHPYADDEYDPGGGYQVKKPMKNPNPDGTFDGPSGGRPMKDNYGDAPSDMQMRDDEYGDDGGAGDAAMRLMKAGEMAEGGDGSIVDAVSMEAERMGAEGIPLDAVIGAVGSVTDGYAFTDNAMAESVLTEAWQRGAGKAKNQMNKNMGKPFR